MRTNDRKWCTSSSDGSSMKANSRERSNATRRETGLLVGFFAVASTILLVGFLILVGFLAFAIIPHAGAGTLPEARRGVPAASILPESLDALYPPVSNRPAFLLKMLELETSFSGIAADLMEDDFDGARESFGDFRRQYREVAGMVPEWRGEYPEEEVKELGKALAVGDKGVAMNAFAAVGGVCHRCHVSSMVPVQQKYHWGNFGAITVHDPLSGTATGYARFKQNLAANLAGITMDLRQGQTVNARKQFEGFQARFAALRGSCQGCHEKESKYFVDREMQKTVEELGNVFRGRTVDADSVIPLVQKIGRESCSKCHLVHLPAAHAGGSERGFASWPIRKVSHNR
jgi:cytochrome c556